MPDEINPSGELRPKTIRTSSDMKTPNGFLANPAEQFHAQFLADIRIEGIGKATLAYRFARFLLSADNTRKDSYTSLDVSPASPVFKLVSNNSHPDLKIIERDYTDTDKKKILKAIKDGEQLSSGEMKELKKSAFIRVDDVRTINEFLSKRSSNDGWRIVIIDSID
ncbi:MAG: hypothetical protein ACLU99_07325 [Alphaproteobacteria bacterium]